MISENEEEFENPNVDPGFDGRQEDGNKAGTNELKGREDERAHNIDSHISISEMREGKTHTTPEKDPAADDQPADSGNDDALNYKNDRENGAYNPKNI